MNDPFLFRKLDYNGSPVDIVVNCPQLREDNVFVCRIDITGLPGLDSIEMGGVDGIQALLCALEALRQKLEKYGDQLRWESGEDGDLGFPMILLSASVFGNTFRREVEDTVSKLLHAKAKAAITET